MNQLRYIKSLVFCVMMQYNLIGWPQNFGGIYSIYFKVVIKLEEIICFPPKHCYTPTVPNYMAS
jgi:hypothetical protein